MRKAPCFFFRSVVLIKRGDHCDDVDFKCSARLSCVNEVCVNG